MSAGNLPGYIGGSFYYFEFAGTTAKITSGSFENGCLFVRASLHSNLKTVSSAALHNFHQFGTKPV